MAIFSPGTLDEGILARKKIVGRPVFPDPFDPGLVPGMPHNFTASGWFAEIPVILKLYPGINRRPNGVPPKRHPDSGLAAGNPSSGCLP
jgi:hypothetical protein